jgi:hypothetical protein
MIRQQGFRAKFKSRQQGAVVIIVAICIVVLVGMLGLVLDLGRLYVTKSDLQNAADAAALSGAKQLDGTDTGICCDSTSSAVGMAKGTASLNSFFSNTGKVSVKITDSDIEFSDTKDGPWVDFKSAQASPANKFFIKVNTASGNLSTWFIHIIPGAANTTSTSGVAVAGRFPPGALTPMFVPVVRRNSDQKSSDVSYPNCSGYIYDPANSGPFKSTCPSPTLNVDPAEYRIFDFSGNWGFLKANQCRQYTATSSDEVSCSTTGPGIEKGSYYVITPQASTKWDSSATQWVSAAAWTGNFGFMLKDSDANAQKLLWESLCTGGSFSQYSVPGCGLVHTGALAGPIITDNLNTRFDEQSKQTRLPHELCSSDTNIFTSTDWQDEGFYTGYLAGSPLVAPTQFPPGKANRRVIRVYVVDNAWLAGYNMAGSNDDSCYAESLTGSSKPAHLVGCAEFFMWKPADGNGKLYAEYVRAVPTNQCNNSPVSNAAIRLYH